jgi:hypothetical protein
LANNYRAVLIGNGEFLEEEQEQLTCLNCPANDVKGMSELLQSPLHGSYEVTALTNKEHGEILEAIDTTLEQATQGDLVLLYYSGHGCRYADGKLYLAAKNTRVKALRRSSVPMDYITESMSRSKADSIVLILDCCFSGAVEKSLLRGKGGAQGVQQALPAENSGSGNYILTASTAYEIAVEKSGDKYSLLTKHIIGGIESGAADRNNDGVVSMEELRQYVQQKIKAEGSQKPDGWALRLQGGELAIAKTGKDVSGERRGKCLPLVYRAALECHVPLRTVRPVLILFEDSLDVPQTTQRAYNTLVDRLYRRIEDMPRFVEELYKVSVDLRRIDKSTEPAEWAKLRKERDNAEKQLKRAREKAEGAAEQLEALEKRAAKDKEKADREIRRLSEQLKEGRVASKQNSDEKVDRMIKQIRDQKEEVREAKEKSERLQSEVRSLKAEAERVKGEYRVRGILQPYLSEGVLFEPESERADYWQTALSLRSLRGLTPSWPLAADAKSLKAASLKFYAEYLEYSNDSETYSQFQPSAPLILSRRDLMIPEYNPTLQYSDFKNLTFTAKWGAVSVSNGVTIKSALDPEKLVEILDALKRV